MLAGFHARKSLPRKLGGLKIPHPLFMHRRVRGEQERGKAGFKAIFRGLAFI